MSKNPHNGDSNWRIAQKRLVYKKDGFKRHLELQKEE